MNAVLFTQSFDACVGHASAYFDKLKRILDASEANTYGGKTFLEDIVSGHKGELDGCTPAERETLKRLAQAKLK